MSFRKRLIPHFYSSGYVVDLVEGTEGRSLVSISTQTFAEKHKLPDEEFSLSDELRSGVPLKEIPCGGLLNSSDTLDSSFTQEDILRSITEPVSSN